MQLLDHLKKRAAEEKPIRVGLVGCGQEGSGFVHVTHQMTGMETMAIADIDVSRPLKTLHDLGIPRSAPYWSQMPRMPPKTRFATVTTW